MHPTAARQAWEEAVYHAIETQLEVCRSDAQALVGPQTHILDGAWLAGLSPASTANLIIEHATPRR